LYTFSFCLTEDNFYDSIEASSPDFGSTSDNQKKLLDPEETAKERKEMEAELAKVCNKLIISLMSYM